MSDSKRRAFYRWYLLERTSPGEHVLDTCSVYYEVKVFLKETVIALDFVFIHLPPTFFSTSFPHGPRGLVIQYGF